MYGVGGIPDAYFNGYLNVLGGTGSGSMNYQPQYNQIINTDSPLEMEVSMTISGQNEIVIQTDVEVTGTISTTNNKIVFILTHYFDAEWFCVALSYDYDVFDLTTIGQTGSYEISIPLDPTWDIASLTGIAIVQTFSGNLQILQGASTMFSGLLPMFYSNVTEGPAHLGVQFTSNSFPLTGIESWEWDFDGDGVFDSTQENPYHLYTEPGSYDVTLRIGVGGEYEETTAEDYITVTDGSDISGQLSGIWVPDNTYTITGDVNIADTDMLYISPGTEIYIENDAQFSINGSLQADASARDGEPIIFTSNSSWQGLRFIGTQANNIIANCEISKATVSAIRIENDSYLDIIGNKICDNSSISLGAAIDIMGSSNVLITQNIIANNFSSNAIGGIQCTNAPIEITNNIIVNNSGTYGALILKNDSDAELTNNTIANNESNGTNQYLFFIFNSAPVIRNCIIIDNNSIFFASGTVDVTYTCITGGYTGTGNIDEDPLFIAPSAGDGIAFNGLNAHWWLQNGSPCIDAGDPDAIYNDPDGSRNDMGAYGGPNGMTPTDAENNVVNIITKNSIIVYPNPFNPQTNIALSITAKDLEHPVSVGIYNIKGQLVKALVDNEVVNNSTFIWDGRDNNGLNTSSGMYFVKMKTVSNITAKKMILLK
jgi:PKD repeat protein